MNGPGAAAGARSVLAAIEGAAPVRGRRDPPPFIPPEQRTKPLENKAIAPSQANNTDAFADRRAVMMIDFTRGHDEQSEKVRGFVAGPDVQAPPGTLGPLCFHGLKPRGCGACKNW